MLARVCAERSVFGFEASFISSRKNSFLSGGVVAGKEHRVKVPYAYRFFSLAANGLSNCPRTAHIVSVAKRRKTMNERPEIVCATCGTDEKALYDAVAKVIEQYKEKEGSLIMVLHAAQEIFGYLPMELQEFIADGMDLPVSEVSGVVSFYSFFSTQKRGKHTIRMCQGTACYVRGGKKVVDAIKRELDVEVGGTTEDGQFTFEIARCIGACGLAPAMMVDDEVYKQVTPAKLRGILAQYEEPVEELAEGGAQG